MRNPIQFRKKSSTRSEDDTRVRRVRSPDPVDDPQRARQLRCLEQPTRRRLYEHVLRLPGDHFRSIVRALGIGVGTACYHLDILVREGIVYERKSGGRARFYAAGDQKQLDRNELFGKHWKYRKTRIRIWRALTRQGESTAAWIADVLGITRQLATYHLGQLEACGFVSREDGRYRVTNSSVAAADLIDETARSS